MAQILKYSAADKKKYITFEWAGRGKGNAALRADKMVRPTCKECQIGLDTPRDWAEHCEHDPYWSLQPKVIKTPVYATDEDGDMVLTETVTRTKMIRVPNITEVTNSVRHNDGEGRKKMQAKGFKLVTEVGIAPMCEMYGCGKAWPVVRTEYGDYCSQGHAKLCIADITEVKFTVNDPRVYRQELQNVVI